MAKFKLSNKKVIMATVLFWGVFQMMTLNPANAQTDSQPKDDGTIQPEVDIQKGNYAKARKTFRTKLIKESVSPQKESMPTPPEGVQSVEFSSGKIKLRGWMNRFIDEDTTKHPAVLFLHGGFAFGREDWDMTQAFRDAGFIVLTPMLRGENGQSGNFTLFYDEIEDVLAAAEYLRKQPFIDKKHIYVAGHSVGGTLALLAAMTSKYFRAAASFSGSPDQIIYVKYGIRKEDVPFDQTDRREFQMRSPLSYSASFKCPIRIYWGTKEPHFRLSSLQTAGLAKKAGLDVGAIEIEGNHFSALPEEMKQSIDFFRKN